VGRDADNMIRTEQLYYLLQVEKYGSINKAAEALFVTGSAVSLAIKQLEKECGYPILERTYRGVRLTEDGKKVVKIAKQIFLLYDEIITLKQGNPTVLQERYNLIIDKKVMKLLMHKIIGPKSKIMGYFDVQEINPQKNHYFDYLEDNTVLLLMLSNGEREKIEDDERVRIRYLYASKQYPVSAKNTKYVKEHAKRIPYEEFVKLPKVALKTDGVTLLGENIVFSTDDTSVFAEAIANDYGIGLMTQFAPDVRSIDYSKGYRIYEPYDEELYVAMIAKKEVEQDILVTLDYLIKS